MILLRCGCPVVSDLMMCCSSLQSMHVRETAWLLSPFLMIGWTKTCFHCLGTWPVARELLNSRIRAGTRSLATAWRRQQGTPSDPAAFLGFRFSSVLYTPFSLTVISGLSGWYCLQAWTGH